MIDLEEFELLEEENRFLAKLASLRILYEKIPNEIKLEAKVVRMYKLLDEVLKMTKTSTHEFITQSYMDTISFKNMISNKIDMFQDIDLQYDVNYAYEKGWEPND